MVEGVLLAEDSAQEKFVATLVRRIADDAGTKLTLHLRSRLRGYGGVLDALDKLASDYARGRIFLPDFIVVAVDANCRGVNATRAAVLAAAGDTLTRLAVLAIADPHIERWYLLDGEAFKRVLGQGCQAPDHKCEKDRYKRLLAEAIRACDVEPLLGGIEYAEDLAQCMSLERAGRADGAFQGFVKDVRAKLAPAR